MQEAPLTFCQRGQVKSNSNTLTSKYRGAPPMNRTNFDQLTVRELGEVAEADGVTLLDLLTR